MNVHYTCLKTAESTSSKGIMAECGRFFLLYFTPNRGFILGTCLSDGGPQKLETRLEDEKL